MRPLIIAIALAAFVLAPGFAYAQQGGRALTNKQLCRRMTRQIAHYEERVLPMARSRGNALWKNSIDAQVNRLRNHRADRCPEWGKQRGALIQAKREWDELKGYVKLAAKGALKYFTGGF